MLRSPSLASMPCVRCEELPMSGTSVSIKRFNQYVDSSVLGLPSSQIPPAYAPLAMARCTILVKRAIVGMA